MNLQSIDLNLLVAFEALMDERNVTRAARRVGLSQPAMSNALTRLRRTFGDPLLVRTPSGMSPTPAAQSLIEAVREALSHLRGAREEKPALNPAASKRAFQGLTSDYTEIVLLAPLIGKLREQAAGVCGHVVIALGVVAIRGVGVRRPALRERFEIASDRRVGIFRDSE